MPGYIIHLTEAELVLNLLKQDNRFKAPNVEEWETQFRIGNLIPDAVDQTQKRYSHFWKEQTLDEILSVPVLSAFLDKNPISLKHPVQCGCYAHLYLDFMFYTEYFPQYVMFCDQNGRGERKRQQVVSCRILKTGETVPVRRMFSGEYIYGDYTKMNHALIRKYRLHIPWDAQVKEFPVTEVSEYSLESVFRELKKALKYGEGDEEKTRVFAMEDLEIFLHQQAQEIANMILGESQRPFVNPDGFF